MRQPAVSGTFYPAQPSRLRADVTGFLNESGSAPPRRAIGVVCPHAGYIYSGATAGSLFAAVDVPDCCIVLAPNHTGRASAPQGGSLLVSQSYRTPLGDLETDRELAGALAAGAPGLLHDDPPAHDREHAVEVILPFLQLRNPRARIVPIVLGWSDWARTKRLADAILAATTARTDVLIVASSDMNHYESADITREKDAAALERVMDLDGEGLLRLTRQRGISMCGRIPAACACEVARGRGAARGEVIAYAHSGLVNGDHERVVGYAAVLLGAT
jgi:AmmeMemoRadiSam system protein B